MRIPIHTLALLMFVLTCSSARADKNNDNSPDDRDAKPKNDGGKNAASLVKKCKSATALVHIKNFGTGSAFCISKEGLFLTNRHVVGHLDVGHAVELVLNSGEKNERVIEAKVVHLSKEEAVDLALLKTEELKDLTGLSLGDDSELVETATVTAFGFPFGKTLAGTDQVNPNVTVTSGKISALRRGANGLEIIQVDGAINPGCSGGPLVDQRGNVVGVIFAGMHNSGIAFAVPVSAAVNYLKVPHLLVSHLDVPYANRFEPHRIQVELVELTPSQESTRVSLKLNSESENPRLIPLEKKGSLYEASVQLFEKSATQEQTSLRILRNHTVTKVRLDDRTVRLAKTDFLLSALRKIEREGDSFLVTTVDGRKFATTEVELPKITLDNGIEFSLAQADQIRLAMVTVSGAETTYEVAVERGDEVVSSTTGTIRCSARPYQDSPDYFDDNAIDEPASDEIIVEAALQGKSSLMMYSNSFWWEHEGKDPPGTKDGSQSYVLVNGKKWHLRWSRLEADKSTTSPLIFKVGGLKHEVRLLSIREQLNGRNRPEFGGIEVQENRHNFEPTRITFKNSHPGISIYRISIRHRVDWIIPTPVTERTAALTSAHWSFDKDSPEVIHDVFGSSHDGYGPSPVFVPSRFGRALAMDGCCINCGKFGDFDRTSHFSVGGWIYLTQLTGTMPILAQMDSRAGHRGYDLSAGAKLTFQLFHNLESGNGVKVSSVEPLNTFRWYHVFATYDGTGNSTGVRLYIDGVPVQGTVEMDRLTDTTKVEAPVQIGMRHPVSLTAEPFRGQLAEVRLYDRALSAEVIRELFLQQASGGTSGELTATDGLIGAWNFDDSKFVKGKWIEDRSGKANPGKLVFEEKDISFVEGKFGKALSLNNRVVKFGRATGDFERTDAFSYGCWVKRTDKSNQALFSKLEQRDPFRGYDLMVQNGKPRMSLNCSWVTGHDEPLRSILVLGEEPVPPNEWHHLLTTYDGTSRAAGVKIYLDGRSMAVKVEKDGLDGSMRTVTPLCLGNRFTDAGAAFDGLIDEAVIFARCLTGTEVLDLVQGNALKP